MLYLNAVDATVTLAGQIVHFVDLQLNQGFNQHHTCDVLINYEEIDKTGWMNDPVGILKKIGEPLTIEFQHKQTGERNIFLGIIKNIKFLGKHGRQNNILFQGISETVKLDGKPSMDSFLDKTLEDIVLEAAENSGNGAKITSKPKYTHSIEYLSMWNETCFDFLNRLSSFYGEAFYSDNGANIYFGLPILDEAIPIIYDVEMTSMELEANLKPAKFQQYTYSAEDDQEWNSETIETRPKTYGYQKVIAEKSDLLFNNENTHPFDANTDMAGTMSEITDSERARDIAGMLVLKGTTHTCKIGVGKVINITYPKGMKIDTTSGDFLITQVTHTINQEGTYSNSFSGIRAALEQIPVYQPKIPAVNSQRAIVVSNDDPRGLGRVKVQFQWQKRLNRTTNWIRVQSMDAGGDTGSGRGFIFIPETGDEVMINFVNSDPSRPYVSGSMFPKSTARGGLDENHLKSIITRSGHTILFNDADETLSITIKDKNGNIIHLDTKGKNIEITAPETIRIKSKNLEFAIEEDIKMDVGRDVISSIGRDSSTVTGRDTSQDSGRKTTIASGDNIEISSNRELDLYGKKQLIAYTDGNTELGAKKQMHMYGGNSLITAMNKIEQKAPDINEVPGKGKFIYNKEPKIMNIKWMNTDMKKTIFNAGFGEKISLLVQTRNYEKGDSISVKVYRKSGEEISDGVKELTLTGTVDEDGFARLKEKVEIQKKENKLNNEI